MLRAHLWLLARTSLLGLFLVPLPSCLHGIKVIGHDRHGEQVIKVPRKKYSEEVAKILFETHKQALESFEAYEPEAPEWDVERFMLGLGIEGIVKIANISTLGSRSRIRLFFEKQR